MNLFVPPVVGVIVAAIAVWAAVHVTRAGANPSVRVAHASKPLSSRSSPPTRAHRASTPATPQPTGVPGHWKLVLNSTFNGHTLNTNVWRTGWFGSGVTRPINSHELACYSPGNVTLPGDGSLHLDVTSKAVRCQNDREPYTGAMLTTNPSDGRPKGGFSFRYGLVQAQVYIPGTGSQIANWPSVITLGQVWPTDGEDDILEGLDGTVCFHFHSPGFAPGGDLGGCDPGFTQGWHIVAADWEPGSVTWYYDGIEVGHATQGITSKPMYLVLADTVSGKARGVIHPSAMRVTYVRVWQHAG